MRSKSSTACTLGKSFAQRCLLLHNRRANGRHLAIEGYVVFPLRRHIVFIEDRRHRAFGHAGIAVDAFLRINEQHRFALAKTVAGTDNNAVRVLASKTRFSHNHGHRRTPSYQRERFCLTASRRRRRSDSDSRDHRRPAMKRERRKHPDKR